ncbi:hypothetical protein BH23ACT8_BH23ACT8_03150 [soil metagenome]
MEAPSREELEARWPYWWLPNSADHALYEARVGGGGRFLIGLLTLTAPFVLLWPLDGELWLSVLSLVLVVTGGSQAVSAIRYATYCYWWAGVNPWWVRTNWLRPVRGVVLAAGTTARTVDAFGRNWAGLVSVLSLVLAVLALVLR